MKIVLASNNKHKLEEFKEILKDFEILTLNDINFYDDIAETGTTFKENALIKAKTIANYLKEKNLDYLVVADDSGLCVDALNGAPGIYSARYAGDHDNQKNRDKLLEDLKNEKNRDAHFICTLCLYFPDDTYRFYEGKTFGHITDKEYGKLDFCFDPIFYSNDLNKTFGEAQNEEKNMVSHRKRAIEKLLIDLTQL